MSVFNSSWLRSLSRRLRDHHPRAYGRLNRIRTRIIAGNSSLAVYQAQAVSRFQSLGKDSVAGKRVLEVGSDVDGGVIRELARLGARSVDGVNPAPEIWNGQREDVIHIAETARLHRTSASSLPFEDEAFDAAISVATFEHIQDLSAVLTEVHRVLRPGGWFYAFFGPIWSSCRGHHVRVQVGDRGIHHYKPETNPLPDFCHLLLSRRELTEALKGRVDGDLVAPVVEWLHDTTWINRLFHHEYLEIFSSSPFVVERLELQTDLVDEQLDRILRFRHPDESRFDVTNMEVVLRK